MIKRLTSLLLNAARSIHIRPLASLGANTMYAPPPILEGLTTGLAPKLAEELRHKPLSTALDEAAAETVSATTNMFLDAHIAELRTTLDAQRKKAQQLRQIVTASELGIRIRSQLADHRGS